MKENKFKLIKKILIIGIFSPLIIFMLGLIFSLFIDLPDFEQIETPRSKLASQIFYSGGERMGEFYEQNRTTCDRHEIADNMFNALISTEDERFMDHSGIDYQGTGRAIFYLGKKGGGSTITQQLALNLYGYRAKNKFSRVLQKFGEYITAVRLEKNYTKYEIITMYLNQFDFLNRAIGINSAARIYFNKKPIDLELHESAMLVGMLKNPWKYNPLRDSTETLKRREQVFFQMKINNEITEHQYDSLKTLSLGLNYGNSRTLVNDDAIYFKDFLEKKVTEIFNEKDPNGDYKYINPKTKKPYNVKLDGLKIYTTIDRNMQILAENAVETHLSNYLQPNFNATIKYKKNKPYSYVSNEKYTRLINKSIKQTVLYKKLTGIYCNECERPGTTKKTIDGQEKNICDFNSNHQNKVYTDIEIEKIFNTPIKQRVFSWGMPNHEKEVMMSPRQAVIYHKGILRSAMMSIHPQTGQVKSWVGGIDYNYFQYDMVHQGKRQVGSTFKPFVYGSAIYEDVVQPCTKIPNIQHCIGNWCPGNSGQKFSGGSVSLRYGLAASMNNIAVATMKKVGVTRVRENIRKMGIPLKDIPLNDATITLGTADISVYDMVAAIATFVNSGIYIEPTTILRIEDKNGNIIYEPNQKQTQVFDPISSYMTVKMMKGVIDGVSDGGHTNGTAGRLRTGSYPYGNLTQPMAGKTGTTQDNSDGWFIGLTPELVTGVWVGGEDRDIRFESTFYGQGASMALPIFGYYMKNIYKNPKIEISQEDFLIPEGYTEQMYNNCSLNIPGVSTQINNNVEDNM